MSIFKTTLYSRKDEITVSILHVGKLKDKVTSQLLGDIVGIHTHTV